MSTAGLRSRLASLPARNETPALLCVTGASGVGKTSALAALGEQIEPRLLPMFAFDSLGVPSADEMQLGWETPRGWQKAMTWFWVRAAKSVYRTRPLVMLEGQFDPQYAIAAASANGVRVAIALIDVDDATRRDRLMRRGQPELATDEMATWAGYLREQTAVLGGSIIDGSQDRNAVVDAICALALPLVTDIGAAC